MQLRADLLIIGSGIAGLRASLMLAESSNVIVVIKADPGESNTGLMIRLSCMQKT